MMQQRWNWLTRRMRMRAWKHPLCLLAVVTAWLAALGWAAALSGTTPLWPHERVMLPAHDFRVVMGAGVEDDEALRIGAIGGDGNALQVHALDQLSARDFPVLRYRFRDFPRTLELSFIFRRADSPEDIHATTVPWPGDGWRSVDLRRIPDWRGQIVEVGFAEFATGQLVPASAAFRPFRFDLAELDSLSWQGGLNALRASWFGYVPWAYISVSAMTPDRNTAGASSPLPTLIAATLLSMLLAALILRWRSRRLLACVVIASCGLWLLLDLRWLQGFDARHALTEQLYAGKSWEERDRLQPDEDVAFVAGRVRDWLAAQPNNQRVLVDADVQYVLLRLIYLLLPRNVGIDLFRAGTPFPPDSLVLLYAGGRWQYDAERRLLGNGAESYPAERVFDSGPAHLYRIRRTP